MKSPIEKMKWYKHVHPSCVSATLTLIILYCKLDRWVWLCY